MTLFTLPVSRLSLGLPLSACRRCCVPEGPFLRGMASAFLPCCSSVHRTVCLSHMAVPGSQRLRRHGGCSLRVAAQPEGETSTSTTTSAPDLVSTDAASSDGMTAPEPSTSEAESSMPFSFLLAVSSFGFALTGVCGTLWRHLVLPPITSVLKIDSTSFVAWRHAITLQIPGRGVQDDVPRYVLHTASGWTPAAVVLSLDVHKR